MKFAIPTYQRYELLSQLTLRYLLQCGIPFENIYVFCSGEEEQQKYIKTCLYTAVNFVYTPYLDVASKFNYIHSFFEPGEEVVVIEDDIECIKRLAGYNKLSIVTALTEQCVIGFDACRKYNTKLWGISSNNNPFFLKEQVTACFKLIVANFYGFIATDPPIQNTCASKTDYERTILYYLKYNSVVRLDYLCPITKNYKNPGGMQASKDIRAQLEQQSVDYMTKTYPTLCKPNLKKDGLYAEMSLLTQRVNPYKNDSLFDL